MRIDTHQHFWLYDSVRDAWITPDMEAIRRNFLPNDISQTLKENGFDGIVAVQADQSLRETEFLIELSEAYKVIKGIVGWVDLCADVIEGEPDGDFLMKDDFQRGIKALTKYDYTYDLLIRPRHFESTLACVAENPQQNFILDHIAKPDIRNGEFDRWASFIEQLAHSPNVYCKISGMVTEADWKQWKIDDFKRYIDHAVSVFGKQRIVFGSDWPVSLLAATYEQVIEVVEANLVGFTRAELDAFWGGNAVEFYGLK
jgi:L-fuconolactonase